MPEATIAAAALTRQFEFPRQTTENLVQRAKRQRVAAARAPLLTRGPLRHALAESMLGLGLGAEAQTLLRVTMKDDPREAASASAIGLAAIAALLADRPAEAGGLADPRLTGTDEVALWRAIQTGDADDVSPAAAAVLATTAPLLFTYPAGNAPPRAAAGAGDDGLRRPGRCGRAAAGAAAGRSAAWLTRALC